MNPELTALPAFQDNLIWVLHTAEGAWVVDPGQAEPVQAFLRERHLPLRGILVTHHHADHIGGVEALLAGGDAPGPLCASGPLEALPFPHTPCEDGHTLTLFEGVTATCWATPGHTLGHVSWVVHTPSPSTPPLLFCGDTLFSAGCGRVFTGTYGQLHDSLMRLGALPPDTQVCCAHDYTAANVRFARQVEPHNAALRDHEIACEQARQAHRHLLPSNLALEHRINPFLRLHEPAVIEAARAHGARSAHALDCFEALRLWKNQC